MLTIPAELKLKPYYPYSAEEEIRLKQHDTGKELTLL